MAVSQYAQADEEGVAFLPEAAPSKGKVKSKIKSRSKRSTLASKFVESLQELRLPWKRNVPIITGLDRILLTSPPPSAAEVVFVGGVQPPRYLWYMLSGALCDIIQVAALFLLHQVIEDGSACWCLGFVLTIPFRHSSHRYLVFGDYVGGFYKSLGRMYLSYSVIICLSTIFNFVMSRFLKISVAWLWILTLLWTGVANYFILKYFWSYGATTKISATGAGSATITAKEMV